ncbi:macrophage colony-stimulating factor 1 isoform X2 [Ambystoma mexicanum]|uniref:macrophage colony-stimulating factor 1 isoform X2 n=1 Tax=Ambystoma mexicanum TaxID=8296 RepID=UPI0037E81FFA
MEPRRRTPEVQAVALAALFTVTWLLGAALPVSGTRRCYIHITEQHMAFLDDLIGNQMNTPCNISFTFVDLKAEGDEGYKACYVTRAMHWVGKILEHQVKSYRDGSTNRKHARELKELHTRLIADDCISPTHSPPESCTKTFSTSPADMLMEVQRVFSMTRRLLNLAKPNPVTCQDDICEEPEEPVEPEEHVGPEGSEREGTAATPGPAQDTCTCPTLEPPDSPASFKPGSPQQHSKDATGPENAAGSGQEESMGRAYTYLLVPCILGILLALSGLLYYRRQNQILRRELQRTSTRIEHQEDRLLNRRYRDELEVELEVGV